MNLKGWPLTRGETIEPDNPFATHVMVMEIFCNTDYLRISAAVNSNQRPTAKCYI